MRIPGARMLYFFDHLWVFSPERVMGATPEHVGLRYEDVTFPAADGTRLNGWWVPAIVRPEDAPTVLWCHGNGGNISARLGDARVMATEVGANVFYFDYRGYGRSDGHVTERGLYADGLGAAEYLAGRADVDPKRVVYFGRSLGSAVAADLALRRPPAALLLESAFPSMMAVAATTGWPNWIGLPVSWALIRARLDVCKRVRKAGVPLLMTHGGQDDVVPCRLGRTVFDAARTPKQWHEVAQAGHNDMFQVGGKAYTQLLRDFVWGHAG